MLRIRGGVMLLAAIAAWCVGKAQASPCAMVLAARLPLHMDHDQLLVDARINDQPVQLVFDTGAFTSTLTTQVAKRLNLPYYPGNIVDLEGIGGRRAGAFVWAETLDVGGLTGRKFPFLTADFSAADGLLSTDLFAKYDLDLDLLEHQILVYGRRGDCSQPTLTLGGDLYALPLRPAERTMEVIVDVAIGGEAFRAAIDTGADRSVLFRDSARRLGLGLDALPSDSHHIIRGIGTRRVVSATHSLPHVQFGDLTINNMRVEVIDELSPQGIDMLLGLDFVTKFHAWISYSSRTLVLQYPPQPSPKPPE